MKANHNARRNELWGKETVVNIVKETFESKSQHQKTVMSYPRTVVNIVKETFESKSQPSGSMSTNEITVVNIVKETFESKSQQRFHLPICFLNCCKYCQRNF